MSPRGHSFNNDNIRTGHLKCDRCRTRILLKSIDQFEGFETRSFECSHCGAAKLVRVESRPLDWGDVVVDRSSC